LKTRNIRKESRLEIEEKKAVITFYSNASPAMVPKSDEHQYCSKDAATSGLPALLINPRFVQTWR